MIKNILALSAVGGALLAAVATATPASAAIKCVNGAQWNSAANGWIHTPYCGDKLIAQVTGYSFTAIRTNPSAKAEACRFKGHNTRISHLCIEHRNFGGRRYN